MIAGKRLQFHDFSNQRTRRFPSRREISLDIRKLIDQINEEDDSIIFSKMREATLKIDLTM